MTGTTSFEIVTVTDGSLQPLVHTVASVLAQTRADFTYTIANGGGESIIPRLPREVLDDPRVRIAERRDHSLWEGMNNAIEAAEGTWLLFLNAGDMFFDRHSAHRMIKHVRSAPEADVHYFDWCTFVRGSDGRLMRLRQRQPDRLESLISKLPFCHQATWTRTDLLRRYRFVPARPGQVQALDHGLYLRAWLDGARFGYHAITTTYYAAGGLSDTRRMQALRGVALNASRIAQRPGRALGDLLFQAGVQMLAIVPRVVRSSARHVHRAREIAGAAAEAAVWLRHCCARRAPRVSATDAIRGVDSLAVLVQFDQFARSIADWAVQTSLIGERTGLLLSNRYGFELDAPHARHLVVEDFVGPRLIFAALLKSCLSDRVDSLTDRAKAQVNSSVIRRFPGRLGHQVPMYSFHRGRSLLTFLLMRQVADRLFRGGSVRRILINDLSYSHNYAFIESAFRASIPVSYYSTGFRRDQLYVRAVTRESDLIHSVTAADHLCEYPRLPLSRARDALSAYYQRCMSRDTYAGARGGWGGSDETTNQSLQQRFNTDRRVVVIFSHVLFDANGAYGVDLFSSMESWLRETLLWYRDFGSDECFVVVKEHPANKFKVDAVSGVRPTCCERLIFDELELASLPNRFGFLSDEESFPTSQLLKEAAGCITVRGSVAIEAAAHGVPVLVAGSSRFSGRGIVNEPTSQLAYFVQLNRFFALSRRGRGRIIANAIRYAECTLYCGGVSTAPWSFSHERGSKPRLVRLEELVESPH